MFSKIRHTSRPKWLIGVVLMAVVVGSLFLIRFQGFAQEPELLQLSDLPGRFEAFEETQFIMSDLDQDEEEEEDKGHFIDTANQELRGYSPEQRRVLSAYHSRQSFGAGGEAFGSGVNVMHFVYDYASPDDAAAAAEILQNDFGQTMSAQPEISAEASASASNLRGARFEILEGSEGDSSYLFIGQRGDSLVIFFVNGFNVDAVSSTYQTVLKKLSDK
ncbi:MAG: hypothetical protein GVY30_04855 [Chloroflexi bacterium]|nr:hypothetical protein [Chloroflexota bacterium]